MSNAIHISNQITKYQNAKKLLEFNNKLVPASLENYATIHAADGGAKSCIGMTLLDYSKGTGPNTVSVTLNISPAQIEWWYTAVLQRHMGFQMSQEKIMSFKKDANGIAPVTKMVVSRNATTRNGEASRCPWYVCCENGYGKVHINPNGGPSIAPQSYRMESQVFVNLTDEEMFRTLYAVHNFIAAWEATFAPALIRSGTEALAKQREQLEKSGYTPPDGQGYNQSPQGYGPAQPTYPNQGQYAQQPQQYSQNNGYQSAPQNYAPAPQQPAQNNQRSHPKNNKKFRNPYTG